jgi:pyridoxamine 5'-phosphate oxidase
MSDELDRDDPFSIFAEWLNEATAKEINDPTAMALATVDDGGLPDVRMVLLKAHGPDGFVFYTNFQSAKGRELIATPKAGLLFHWKSLRRQVRVRGLVSEVSEGEADAYFTSRPRNSQIGAWASDQSRPLEGRLALEERVAEYALKFGVGPVPRPAHWSGFRVTPLEIEFWRDGAFRLHDRMRFRRARPELGWEKTRLYP